MTATEELLIVLGDESNPKLRIFDLKTGEFHEHNIEPDLGNHWRVVPKEVAYHDGMVVVACHDKLLLYGVQNQFESRPLGDAGLRTALFSKSAG